MARILNGGIRAVARTDVRTSAAFAAAPGRPRSAATQDPLDPAECCARAAWRPRAGDRGSARLAAHRQRCREAGAVRHGRGAQRHRRRSARRRHPRRWLPARLRGRRGPARSGRPPRTQRRPRLRPNQAARLEGASDCPHGGAARAAVDRDRKGPGQRGDDAAARDQATQATAAGRRPVRVDHRRRQPRASRRLHHGTPRAWRRRHVGAARTQRRRDARALFGGRGRRRAQRFGAAIGAGRSAGRVEPRRKA